MSQESNKNLSEKFSIACQMIHVHTDKLYETLHDDDGNPILEPELVIRALREFRTSISMEMDLIKTESLDQWLAEG
jgi:hypothetical protein